MRILIVLTCLLMSLSLAQSYEYNQEVQPAFAERGIKLGENVPEVFSEPLADTQLAEVNGEGPLGAIGAGLGAGAIGGAAYGINTIVTGQGSWSGAAGAVLGAAAAGAAAALILPSP